MIAPDEIMLPPRLTTKRGSGRPKKKRIKKRLKQAGRPEESRVQCSRCHRRGHNARTCDGLASDVDDNDDRKPSAVVRHELDLS